MNYGSICSGVEAASLAWMPLGWKAKFFAEVEPFPSAVLQQKFGATKPLRPLIPEEAQSDKDRKLRESWAKQIAELPDTGTLPNLGDFTKISTKDYNGTIDLLVGGTPCQSYSVAGLRKGLADPRGNLALEFVKLAYRTGVRWTCWENVPGVLSSGAGKDFASFLSLLCGWEVDVPRDGWKKCGIVTPAPGCFGVAWRILDAQYTRVSQFPRAIPQRRRRLFVIGYLGSWEYPAKVLFDGEMCGGDSPPVRTKRQTAAPCSESGTGETGSKDVINLIPYGMRLGAHQNGVASTITRIDAKFPQCVCLDSLSDGTKGQTEDRTDTAETIRERCGCPGGGKGILVSHELSLTLATGNDQMLITHPDVECLDMRQVEVHDTGIAPTLIATDYKGGKAVSFYPYLQQECPMDECSNTLINGDCPGHQNAVAFSKDGHPQTADGGQNYREAEVAKTLNGFATGESRADELVCEDGACPTLDANYPGKMNNQDVGKLVCCEHHPQDARLKETEVNATLGTFHNSSEGKDTVVCFENHGNDSRVTESEGIAPTITSRAGTGGNNLPLVMTADEPIGFIKNDAGGEEQGFWKEVFPTVRSQVIPAVAYNVSFCDANGTRKDRPDGGLYVTEAEISKTVTAGGTNAETVIIDPVALDGDKMAKAERKGGSGLGISTEGVMYTQTAKDVHAVAYEEPVGIDQYNGAVTGDASATLGVNCGDTTGRNGVLENGECVPLDLRNATRDPEKHDEMNRQGVGVGADGDPMNTVTAGAVPGIGWQAAVRRLLPVECERLMGFPDGHTLIKWKGKPESECPDAPRYKACGNSMCVNVMVWIGQRIDAVEKEITSNEVIETIPPNGYVDEWNKTEILGERQ